MFQAYHEHHRLGRAGDFVVKHEAECTTMKILEGSTVLINMNEIKASKSSGSSDSSNASSPESGSEPPEPSTQHGAYDQSYNENIYVANNPHKDVQNDDRITLCDFSGVYYTSDAHPMNAVSPHLYMLPWKKQSRLPRRSTQILVMQVFLILRTRDTMGYIQTH